MGDSLIKYVNRIVSGVNTEKIIKQTYFFRKKRVAPNKKSGWFTKGIRDKIKEKHCIFKKYNKVFR